MNAGKFSESELAGKPEIRGKEASQSAASSTMNPTSNDVGWNPVCRPGKLASNRQSHGTVSSSTKLLLRN
jgi:hypothetical protein